MKKIPAVGLIGRGLNLIIGKVDLRLMWYSSLIELEHNLQLEKQKNEDLIQELNNTKAELTHELSNTKAELSHFCELQESVESGQILNTQEFFTKTLDRLDPRSLDDLQKEEIKALYNSTLKDAFLVLSSEIFETLELEFQVKLLQKIFLAMINISHRNANLIGDLIADHFVRILGRNDLQEVMIFKIYECLYGLYWCGASSLNDMKKFDLVGVRPFEEYFNRKICASLAVSERTLLPKPQLKICYFCHYAHFDKGNAISPLIMSIAKAHALFPNRQIFVYCVQWARDEVLQCFAGTDIVVCLLAQQAEYQSVDEIIAQMKVDEIDVAITDISSSIATYIFLNRAAPIQMWLELGYPYWSISKVDWVFLCAKDYQSSFGVPVHRCSSVTPAQEEVTLQQSCNQEKLAEAQAILPKGVTNFAVFTRLIKITPAYLNIVRRILVRNQQSHFLVVGTGDPRLIYNFMAEENISGRVTFLHYNVDLNVYGRVVDVFLDTFPFIGGLACREVAIHGKPVVSLRTLDFERFLLDERDPELLATSADEYVEMACRLATDPEFYQARSQMAVSFTQTSTKVDVTATHIDEVIQKLIRQDLGKEGSNVFR